MLSGLISHLHHYDETLVIWKNSEVHERGEDLGGMFPLRKKKKKSPERSLQRLLPSLRSVLSPHLLSDSPGLLQFEDTGGIQQPRSGKGFSTKRVAALTKATGLSREQTIVLFCEMMRRRCVGAEYILSTRLCSV